MIEVKNISKQYNLGQSERYIALRDILAGIFKNPLGFIKEKLKKDKFWALDDINFSVKKGEAVGIIGANGAGKSTLLKVLSRITPPTKGKIKLQGRVVSLLEVGTGFHPELSGRENIFLNGAILGMKKKEINSKFNEIVEFSGVKKFLDTPVKHYSSGMYVRLAFSVASHMDPDVLLVDEVLAVGDIEFQKKCLGKMNEVMKEVGRTILFVSHNMGAIQNLCQRCILLENGKIKMIGPTEKVIEKYCHQNSSLEAVINYPELRYKKIQIRKIKITDKNGLAKTLFDIFEKIKVTIFLDLNKDIQQFHVSIFITTKENFNIVSLSTSDNGHIELNKKTGKYKYSLEIPHSFLNEGFYNMEVSVGIPDIERFDRVRAGQIKVENQSEKQNLHPYSY